MKRMHLRQQDSLHCNCVFLHDCDPVICPYLAKSRSDDGTVAGFACSVFISPWSKIRKVVGLQLKTLPRTASGERRWSYDPTRE
jgi:hypothetical protein